MQQFQIPYGTGQLTVRLPDGVSVDVLNIKPVPPAADQAGAIGHALDHPAGKIKLSDFQSAKTAAIAINDKTRPIPLEILLPPLLQRLEGLGIAPQSITLIIATGTHLPMPPAEFTKILPPEIIQRYRVISHDCRDEQNLISVGTTSRGTPVRVNQAYRTADLRIALGGIEAHQFMGFSGGMKSAAIGLTAWETINKNHSMILDPNARLACYAENPMRQDVEEIGKLIGVHFALNVILNEQKQILSAIAGEPLAVMQAGIPQVMEIFQVPVEKPYDLVISSPGGYPRDINLYQAQKGLSDAAHITRKGGTVILAAACSEGTGSKGYEEWVIGMQSHEQVLERFRQEGFRVGPHKAFQIARDAAKVRIVWLSQMAPDFARKLLLTPANTIDEALQLVQDAFVPGARVAIIPLANTTIPILKAES